MITLKIQSNLSRKSDDRPPRNYSHVNIRITNLEIDSNHDALSISEERVRFFEGGGWSPVRFVYSILA